MRMPVARGVLQQECIKFLLKTNNKAKVRRATGSLVLGKAEVMSSEDLVEARTKQTEKDSRKAAKTQRRKRKGEKEGALDVTFEAPLVAAAESADGRFLMAQAQHTAAPIPPCPSAAPVARMWEGIRSCDQLYNIAFTPLWQPAYR